MNTSRDPLVEYSSVTPKQTTIAQLPITRTIKPRNGNGNGHGNVAAVTSTQAVDASPQLANNTNTDNNNGNGSRRHLRSVDIVALPIPLSGPFDVIRELECNRDSYSGSEPFSLYSVPGFVRTCLSRIRARVHSVQKPSIAISMSCCISNGILSLASNNDVRDLLQLKERLDLLPTADWQDYEQLAEWFRSFRISVPDGTGGGIKQLNITMPESVRNAVCNFASDLGVSNSVIGTLAAMVTLSVQSSMLGGQVDALNDSVEQFYRKVSKRKKVAEVLLGLL